MTEIRVMLAIRFPVRRTTELSDLGIASTSFPGTQSGISLKNIKLSDDGVITLDVAFEGKPAKKPKKPAKKSKAKKKSKGKKLHAGDKWAKGSAVREKEKEGWAKEACEIGLVSRKLARRILPMRPSGGGVRLAWLVRAATRGRWLLLL